ncbi:MFS transporter [Rhodococcus sp. RS1C4]|nr:MULTISPECIES: sugar porter family MFS transporter [Rhodococcus]OZC50061.1 MFS transporter [Rhodococcus sp. RS1C4]OZC76274.1 MFS transporter [Rhodococcus sp. 06-418-1B]OZD13445.1 MFS transporter [Rhodococcus sp. 06-156-3C]OZD14090.1 MFS transporter [Rhodococcus sp. 06-156-4C]OZD28792.1 MFS transporter [Rhodococcus sp. 06-156-3]OZD34979.1 MFS transporter [Rhodococcus sp. 06-156-3b]OZD65689.1 MFS transporter [Rhodococcus sp. 06-1059B-a]OZE80124.1 MFS transporter [Rhodococcus sp. 15-649-1-2]
MSTTPTRRNAKVIGVSVAAAVGGFLFGFDSSVINGAVDAIEGRFSLGSFTTGFVVAIALIGCAVGAWFAGSLADRWGRKKVMVLGSALFTISSLGSGLAFSVPDLILWRILGGLGIGIASVIAPAYIAEIAPAKWRGSLASLQQLAITLGIFAALLSDALLQGAADGASNDLWLGQEAWRWMFLVGVVPALIYGLLAVTIPESPRYLVGKHLDQEAADILANITGELHPDERVHEIRLTLRKEEKASFADIRGPKFGLQPIVWVGIVMAVLQQFVGINAIFYYSTTLWKSVGFTEDQSFTTSVITSIINVTMTFVAILFVDRIGRRKLLLGGSVGMFVGLLMAAISFSQQIGSGDDVSLPSPWGAVALVGANLFVIFFAATWGPIMWVLLGEMFPNRMRAVALGIGTAANWLANFAVTLAFPPLTQAIGLWAIYGFFAVMAAVSFFFVKSKIPETNGKELEDMQ